VSATSFNGASKCLISSFYIKYGVHAVEGSVLFFPLPALVEELVLMMILH
jgi:hypothetical protein